MSVEVKRKIYEGVVTQTIIKNTPVECFEEKDPRRI